MSDPTADDGGPGGGFVDVTAGSAAIGIGLALVALFVARVLYAVGNVRATPWFVAIAVFLGWTGPFSIIYFLPLDLSSSKYRGCLADLPGNNGTGAPRPPSATPATCHPPLIYVDEATQRSIWQGIYWSMFGLSWFIIPILQSYMSSGGFTPSQCLRKALKYNGWYYSVLGLIGAVALGYVAVVRKMDFASIKSICMALSNAYGLILVVLLLSYGLVAVPRAYWQDADPRRALLALELSAPNAKDALDAAARQLVAAQREVAALEFSVAAAHPLRKYVDRLLVRVPTDVRVAAAAAAQSAGAGGITGAAGTVRRWFSGGGGGGGGGNSANAAATAAANAAAAEITLKGLQQLHRNLNHYDRLHNACLYKWERMVSHAHFLQDVLDNADNSDRRFHEVGRFRTPMRQRILWFWYVRMRPWFLRGVALATGLLSTIILWSEATQPFGLSALDLVERTDSYMVAEAVSVGVMVYLSCCVYIPLLKVRVLGTYAVLPGHHTDVPSLLFFGNYLTRLAFPLGWNLLNLAGADAVFSRTMSSVAVVAPLLGPAFSTWIPVTMVLLTGTIALNLHAKILGICGVRGFIDEEDLATAGEARADGRALLQQAKADRERRRLAPLGAGDEGNGGTSGADGAAPGGPGTDPERGGLLSGMDTSSTGSPPVLPRSDWDDEFVPLGKRKPAPAGAAKRAAAAAELAASRSVLAGKAPQPQAQPQAQQTVIAPAPPLPPAPPRQGAGLAPPPTGPQQQTPRSNPETPAASRTETPNASRASTFAIPKSTSYAFGALRNATGSGLRAAAAAASGAISGATGTAGAGAGANNAAAPVAPSGSPSLALRGDVPRSQTAQSGALSRAAAPNPTPPAPRSRNLFDDV